MTLQSKALENGDPKRTIDVATVRKPGANPTNKNFFLFGEHSRELISPESGLHFLKSLCGETSLSQRAQSILDDSEFQIVVSGNPGSRTEVEGGKFCLPANPNAGPEPFSEFETQTFKDLVRSYKPTS